MNTKHCNQCDKDFPHSNFYRDRTRSDGLQARCKDCCRINTQTYHRENKAKVAAYNKQWRQDNKAKVADYKRKSRARARTTTAPAPTPEPATTETE